MHLTRPSLYCPSLVICIFCGSWDWPDRRERPRRLCWTSVNPSNYIRIWQLHSYTTPRMLRAFTENRCEYVRNIPKTRAHLLLKVGKVGGVSLCGGFTPACCWARSPLPTAERWFVNFTKQQYFLASHFPARNKWSGNQILLQYLINTRSNHY